MNNSTSRTPPSFLLLSDNAAFVAGESEVALIPYILGARITRWLSPLVILLPFGFLGFGLLHLLALLGYIQLELYSTPTTTLELSLGLICSSGAGLVLAILCAVRYPVITQNPTNAMFDLDRLEKMKRGHDQRLCSGRLQSVEVVPLYRQPMAVELPPDEVTVEVIYQFVPTPAKHTLRGKLIFRTDGRTLEQLLARGMGAGASVQVLYEHDRRHWLL